MNALIHFKNEGKNHDLADVLRTLDAECRNCAPLNPLECTSNCKTWKLKNELRQLRETLGTPTFLRDLFNVLKNEARLHILGEITKGRYSTSQLQEELKKVGYTHSQETVNEEYIQPLIGVGLATEGRHGYYATILGDRLADLLVGFPDFVNVLPPHSECYEETLLSELLSGPKTFQEVEALISPKIASRILKRLKNVGLIETPEERDYVFFFKSKRDSNKETLTSTESKIYGSIPEEGISAKQLAAKNELSIRRIYKYLRGLKGKKLVFSRKNPKTYGLSVRGEKLATLLRDLENFIEEIWNSSEQLISYEKS